MSKSKQSKAAEESEQASEAEPVNGAEQADPQATEAEESQTEAAEVDPLHKALEERDHYQGQLQRTLADLQNFRKRRAQEMAEARKLAIEAFTTDILPVLDNFHLAIQAGDQDGGGGLDSVREGMRMVQGMLEGVLQRHGVTEIPAEGQDFDPNVHEAVGIDPNPDAEPNKVSQIMLKGYSIEGKVIRPTRVMVGGSGTAQAEAPATADDQGEPQED